MAFQDKGANSSFTEEWSNIKCIEIAFSDNFPTLVKDIQVQKEIIQRYLNFYLGSKIQKGYTVSDVALAVISIMPQHEITEQFLWEDKHYKDDGTLFFLTPGDGLNSEIEKNNINSKGENKSEDETENNDNIEMKTVDNDRNDVSVSDPENNVKTEASTEIKMTENKNNIPKTDKTSGLNIETRDPNNKNIDNKSSETQEQERPSTSRTQPNDNDKLRLEAKPTLPPSLNWYSRMPKVTAELTIVEYGPADNAAFNASCNKLFESWETSEKSRIVMKYFFGIIALTSMRAATKSYKHLNNTFRSSKFLSYIAFANGYIKYNIPHKRCIKNSCRTFRKRDGRFPIMFAKIIVNSFHIDAERRIRPKGSFPKLNILKLTVLAYTTDYGLGLVSMIQNIETRMGINGLDKVLDVTYCKETAESWNKLVVFLKSYVARSSKEATHHWARIVSAEFFRDISCGNNYELAVILGVFIEQMSNNTNIWRSAWVGEHADNLENLKDRGYKMYKHYKRMKESSPLERL